MDEKEEHKNQTPDSTELLARRLQSLLDEQWEADPQEETPHEEKVEEMPPKVPGEATVSSGHDPTELKSGMTLFHDVVYILAVVVLSFTFFIRMSRVEGNSMNPTLVDHDRMLLLSSMWYRDPQRGDIVVARIPEFSRDPIVKRVIAVEGDTVNIDFQNGIVYVNGEAIEEPYIKEPTYTQFFDQGLEFPVEIEAGHVFLMGDNRNDSYDSRYAVIGQVDKRYILGKAFMLVFPGWDSASGVNFSRIGLVK